MTDVQWTKLLGRYLTGKEVNSNEAFALGYYVALLEVLAARQDTPELADLADLADRMTHESEIFIKEL